MNLVDADDVTSYELLQNSSTIDVTAFSYGIEVGWQNLAIAVCFINPRLRTNDDIWRVVLDKDLEHFSLDFNTLTVDDSNSYCVLTCVICFVLLFSYS